MNRYLKSAVLVVFFFGGICLDGKSAEEMRSSTTELYFPLPESNVDSTLYKKIEKVLDTIFEKYDLPGMIVAYKLDAREPQVLSFGKADLEQNITMQPDHRMLAGSVGKTFVAALVLLLESEGKLSLDDPISKYISDKDWYTRLPNHNKITIHHLLTHSSGIIDHVKTPEFAQNIQQKMADPNTPPDFAFQPEELIDFVLDKESAFKPGKDHNYTDTGYIILGMIIEKVGGDSYYSLLENKILKPFHLQLTSPSDTVDLEYLTAGYLKEENPLGLPIKISENGKMVLNPATEWTGGGLISNPADLVSWASLLFEGGLLEGEYVKKILLNKKKVKNYYYGLGAQIAPTNRGKVYGHGGWFPGYRTLVGYFPDSKVAIATQINRDFNVPLEEIEMSVLKTIQDHKK